MTKGVKYIWLIRRKNSFGLDIGSHSIKGVEFEWDRKTPGLKHFGMIELQPGAIVDGALNSASLAESIGTLVERAKIRTRDVAVSLPHTISNSRILRVPRATINRSDQRFLNQLYHDFMDDLDSGIGCDIEDAIFDYQFLDEPGKSESVSVLFVAAPKEMALSCKAAIEKAGLSPVIFESDASAFLNAYNFLNFKSRKNEVVALVNWGAHNMNINLLVGGMPVRIRHINIGGSDITENIQKRLKLSYEEAEAIKLKKQDGAVQNAEVEEIIWETAEQLPMEVRRQLDFFFAITPLAEADFDFKKIFISGGCSIIRQLSAIIKERLDVLTEVFNPFFQIDFFSESVDPVYIKEEAPVAAVAVGLALRGGRTLSRINLLPK